MSYQAQPTRPTNHHHTQRTTAKERNAEGKIKEKEKEEEEAKMSQSQQSASASRSSLEPQPNPIQTDPKYDHYDFPIVAAEPQQGHAGYTTPEQDAQVFQLRTMLEQEGYTDRLDTLTLLRFLRARKFSVQAAKDMYVLFLPLFLFFLSFLSSFLAVGWDMPGCVSLFVGFTNG